MKRIMLILVLAAMAAINASAQTGLEVNAIFNDRYRGHPNTVQTYIAGSQLESYGLTLYRSLTINGMPDEAETIEHSVTRDGTQATEREISYRDGRLYYAFYDLPPIIPPKKDTARINRYLFFLNQHCIGGDKIIIIYMEGKATHEQIKEMLK